MRIAVDLSRAEWIKSSYSDGNGGECVEFTPGIAPTAGVVTVRDSKHPADPALLFPMEAWTSFTTAVRGGEFPAL
ncbi:DUF397 domain-containing protein [Streptomyces luomodiensis]|uniref:DUF397 domain-containing protein n=1 Tax=Streptomyces luomodiensis TaxID=3026192 RepID=A0ABY9V4S8_9ACTN|nr:DUF397 domain-containing protein [Streptomyces sp. SCA4-21]WNE99015.1 DUF397 domain-containing protein [Streptomyces sp. SCA4-21]